MLGTYVRLDCSVLHTTDGIWFCDDPRTVPLSVLIVDDHPSFRASARAMMEADGYEVVGEACDGATALALAAELDPDCALVDVQLPDMTGFDVCASLVERNGKAVAVILVSSRDACDYGDLVEACGARGFVPKADLSGEAVASLLE